MRWVKKRIRGILAVVLLLIAIHLALNFITVTTHTQETRMVPTAYVVYEPYEEVEQRQVQRCEDVPYNWTYTWGEWELLNDLITPTYVLTNGENREGDFNVRFTFFDEALFKFDRYEEISYGRVKDDLIPSFYSNNVTVSFQPGETQEIRILTRKPDSAKQYWVYAETAAPTLESCEFVEEDVLVSGTRNVTTYKDQEVIEDTSKTQTLWEIVVEKYF